MSIALTTPCGTPPSCCDGGGGGWWPEGCCPTTGATNNCSFCKPCTPDSMTVVIDQGPFQGTHILPFDTCQFDRAQWKKTADGAYWRLQHGGVFCGPPNDAYPCARWNMLLYRYSVAYQRCGMYTDVTGCHPAIPVEIGASCSYCPGASMTITDAGAGTTPCATCVDGYAANTLVVNYTDLCGRSGSIYLYFTGCWSPYDSFWANGAASATYYGYPSSYWKVYLPSIPAYGVSVTNCNGSRVCNEAFELLVEMDGTPITPTCYPPPCTALPTSIMVTPDPCDAGPGVGACAQINDPPLCVLCDGQEEANCFTFRRNIPAIVNVGQCFKINTTPGMTPDFTDQCNSWEQYACLDEYCNTGFPYLHNCSYFYAHSFALYDNLTFTDTSWGCDSACQFRTSVEGSSLYLGVVGKVYGGLTTGCGGGDPKPAYSYYLYATWELVAPSAGLWVGDLLFGVMTFFIRFPTGGGPYGASSFWKIIGQAWSNEESFPCGECQICNQTWPVCCIGGDLPPLRMCNFVVNHNIVCDIGAFFPCCE